MAGLEQQTNKNHTIKSIEYTRPRLIIMSQAIGNQRVLKFLSSGWDMYVRRSLHGASDLPPRGLVLLAAGSASKVSNN